jgi:hypothetical protein
MPPCKAADGCNEYNNYFSLTDEDKATIVAWIDAGLPEGEDDNTATQEVSDPLASGIRHDLLFDAADEPYQPTRNDNYRCYAIPWPFEDAKYITGFDMIPGDPTNVHHVNIFLNPRNVDYDFVAFDEEDPEPGYSCSRGDRTLQSTLVGAWAPGAAGLAYPAGTGQLVEPGSSITLEVHYAIGGEAALPDLSRLALQIEDTVERRAVGAAFYWFNNWDNGGMLIPAGDDDVTHDLEMDPALPLSVIAPWIRTRNLEVHLAALHMHQLGKSAELKITSPVGDTCLLNIPEWDFNWQNGYELKEPAFIFLGEDKLYLRCTWDNSAEGAVDVNWGGRTTDEMCIGFVYLVPEQ